MNENLNGELTAYLQDLHLPAMRMNYRDVARQAEQEAYSYEQYLHELATRECAVRRKNRTERLLRESELPLEKTLACFDMKRLPMKAARQVKALLDGRCWTVERTFSPSAIPAAARRICCPRWARN